MPTFLIEINDTQRKLLIEVLKAANVDVLDFEIDKNDEWGPLGHPENAEELTKELAELLEGIPANSYNETIHSMCS